MYLSKMLHHQRPIQLNVLLTDWNNCLSPTKWFSSSQISINTALKTLNLSPKTRYSPKELRDAYFTAAKFCHPDSPSAKVHDEQYSFDGDEEKQKEFLTNRFHAITEAYELLQKKPEIDTSSFDPSSPSSHDFITKSEEEHFREACKEFLGVDAEIVEESKQCPLFREWLKGTTVDAFLWNLFLMKHGGLAPMLQMKKILNIAEGDQKKRRRRKK